MDFIKILTISITCTLLAACAFVPEQVQLNPNIHYAKTNIGHGNPVAVRVVDARTSTTVGGRASEYGPAGKITIKNNINNVVRKAVYKGLRSNGFKPVDSSNDTARSLTVRISGLQYNQRTGFWVGHIDISAALGVSARNHQKTFEQVYRNSSTQGVMFTPTSDSDHDNINQALSIVLNKLVNDVTLMHFLAKP